jgi:hypothetical protein
VRSIQYIRIASLRAAEGEIDAQLARADTCKSFDWHRRVGGIIVQFQHDAASPNPLDRFLAIPNRDAYRYRLVAAEESEVQPRLRNWCLIIYFAYRGTTLLERESVRSVARLTALSVGRRRTKARSVDSGKKFYAGFLLTEF